MATNNGTMRVLKFHLFGYTSCKINYTVQSFIVPASLVFELEGGGGGGGVRNDPLPLVIYVTKKYL